MMSETLIQSSILKIGNVTSVEGRFIKVSVDKTKNSSHLLYKGKTLKNVSVGSYIKICKGFERIIGKIEGEYIVEEKGILNKEYRNELARVKRVLNVSLLGFMINGNFERGIKELPLIDNECFLLNDTEFSRVHDFIRGVDQPIELGHLAQEKGRKINVGMNCLFASHIGIFGNTGSGKSYTLAKLYRELLLKFKDKKKFQKNASFYLIDFNGEYLNDDRDNDNVIIEKEFKNTFRLSTKDFKGDRFPISSDLVTDSTIWMILLEATEKTQTPFIKRTLDSSTLEAKLSSGQSIKQFAFEILKAITGNSDKALEKNLLINFLWELDKAINDFSNGIKPLIQMLSQELQYNSTRNYYYLHTSDYGTIYSNQDQFFEYLNPYFTNITIDDSKLDQIKKIRLKFIFNYYDEIVKGFSNKEHLSPLLKRLTSRINDILKLIVVVEDEGSYFHANFTVISLKEVNIHMRKVLPLLFCKQFYEKKKLDNNRESFLNIIIDEAHNILSSNSMRESELWKDYRLETFEEIIKEGRKFGVFLTIASQRPYDISSTIISQLHNYFLHRLINNNDIMAIERTVSYLDKVSFDSLPILPTGTCILAGLAAQVPVVVEIDKIEDKYKPFNQTIQPLQYWE
jgi:uncharacterized protein